MNFNTDGLLGKCELKFCHLNLQTYLSWDFFLLI